MNAQQAREYFFEQIQIMWEQFRKTAHHPANDEEIKNFIIAKDRAQGLLSKIVTKEEY